MTAQTIYERALDLCGLRNTDGTVPASCADITQRAPSLITQAAAKYAYLDKKLSKRAAVVYPDITALSQTVDMHAGITNRILPYMLAYLIINAEDAALADLFKRIADAEESEVRSFAADCHAMTEVY